MPHALNTITVLSVLRMMMMFMLVLLVLDYNPVAWMGISFDNGWIRRNNKWLGFLRRV